MTDIDVDPTTGLPWLPGKDYRWRITRAYGYGSYDGHVKLQRSVFGIYWTLKKDLTALSSTSFAGPKNTARGVLGDYNWNLRQKEISKETKLRKAKYKKDDEQRKKDRRKRDREATKHLIGNYPPKKFSE